MVEKALYDKGQEWKANFDKSERFVREQRANNTWRKRTAKEKITVSHIL